MFQRIRAYFDKDLQLMLHHFKWKLFFWNEIKLKLSTNLNFCIKSSIEKVFYFRVYNHMIMIWNMPKKYRFHFNVIKIKCNHLHYHKCEFSNKNLIPKLPMLIQSNIKQCHGIIWLDWFQIYFVWDIKKKIELFQHWVIIYKALSLKIAECNHNKFVSLLKMI